MATKLAKNGTYMEYIVVRPTAGLNAEQIATAICMWYADEYDFKECKVEKHNIKQFFYKNNTWNKVMAKVKQIILEEGMTRMDYAWESITCYDDQIKKVKDHLKIINPKLGTTKEQQ